MLSRSRFHELLQYSRKKDRVADGRFFVDGWRWLAEVLAAPDGWECFLYDPTAPRSLEERDLLERAVKAAPESYEARPDQLARLAGLASSPGVVSLLKWSPRGWEAFVREAEAVTRGLIAMLDGVGDPGNAGTIVRTADWFGLQGVVFGRRSVEPTNPKVLRATMGSLFNLSVGVASDTGSALESLRGAGYVTVGAALDGVDVTEFAWPERTALVVGNEANGLSEEAVAALDQRVRIPSFGRAQSLNAAVAFAVLASDWRRRFH